MTRIFLLLAATGFAAACMSSGTATDMNPAATDGEAIAEPTDGIDNETTDSVDM